MGRVLAILFTMTTYGTWLRGDERGWIADGELMAPDPKLEAADRARLTHPPFYFDSSQLHQVGEMIGNSLMSRLLLDVYALAVQTWHVHFVSSAGTCTPAQIAKCAKEAVRYGLRPGRPIWTAGYDKRYCYDERAVISRVRYVERHNEAMGWSPRPWEFLTALSVAPPPGAAQS